MGDLMGLPTDANHYVYRWLEPECKVLFSATRQGEAMSIHLASDKKGLRRLKQALNEFCEYVFKVFSWCKMIIGKVNRRSIANLVVKCGFSEVYRNKDKSAWVRSRV